MPDVDKSGKVGGPNKAHTLGGKCLQNSISQRLVQNLAHIWVNLLGIVRLQNIDLQLIIYWHMGHFLRWPPRALLGTSDPIKAHDLFFSIFQLCSLLN